MGVVAVNVRAKVGDGANEARSVATVDSEILIITKLLSITISGSITQVVVLPP